jgi:hypothetical protein
LEKEKARKKIAKRKRKVEPKKVMESVQIQEKQKVRIIQKEECVIIQSKNASCFYMQILNCTLHVHFCCVQYVVIKRQIERG